MDVRSCSLVYRPTAGTYQIPANYEMGA